MKNAVQTYTKCSDYARFWYNKFVPSACQGGLTRCQDGLTRFMTYAGTPVYPYSSAQRYVLWDESVEAWLHADIMIAGCRKISFNDVGNQKNV